MANVESIKRQLQDSNAQLQEKFNSIATSIKDREDFPGAQYVQRYNRVWQDYPLSTLFMSVQLSLFALPVAFFLVVVGSILAGVVMLATLWMLGVLVIAATALLTTLSVLFFVGIAIWAWLASLMLTYRAISDVRQRGLQASLNTLESNIRGGVDQTRHLVKQGADQARSFGQNAQSQNVRDQVEEKAEDVKSSADKLAKKGQDAVKDVKKGTEDAVKDGQDKAKDAKDSAKSLAKQGQDKAENVKQKGEKKASKVKDEASDKVDKAASSA